MTSQMIAAWLGAALGGILPVILFAILFEKALFSMVFDDPVFGKGMSVIASWLLVSIFYGLNATGWRGFDPRGFATYGISAVPVLIYYMHRGFKLRHMQDEIETEQAMNMRLDHDAARPFE